MVDTAGFLYPGYSAEDDYPALQQRLGAGVRLPLVHTLMRVDAHRVDQLRDWGAADLLADGAAQLVQQGVQSVVWACTSGSFVHGWDGAHEQVEKLQGSCGLPSSSTSFAFVNAARALGVRRVAVAATYPDDVAELFAEFLGAAGIEVLRTSSRGIVTAAEVGTLNREQVLDFAAAGIEGSAAADAEAVLLPDTALHSANWLDELEDRVGRPVLTANQVSAWEGLRLAGHRAAHDGLGSLFRHAPAGVADRVTAPN